MRAQHNLSMVKHVNYGEGEKYEHKTYRTVQIR